MSKIFRIIKPFKTKGLDIDCNIFAHAIRRINKNLTVIISESNIKLTSVDYAHLYISTVEPKLIPYCTNRYFMINHELFLRNETDTSYMNSIDLILCRNQIGYDWAEKVKAQNNFSYKSIIIKFTSEFPIEPKYSKSYNLILHSAGEHHWKQTDIVIKTWLSHPELPLIVITCVSQCYRNIENLLPKSKVLPPNMYLYKKLLDYGEFIKIKNEAGIHLCPSIVEGYGHYLNEARKVKSLVITTNLAPMNELITPESGLLIDCAEIGKKSNGADLCFITEDDLVTTVKKAIGMSIEDRKKLIDKAYDDFISDTKYYFRAMGNIFTET